MKLTQAITNWLHKMFAWWPWKQSTQIEYSAHANSVNKGTTQETWSKSMTDGIAPQTGIVPRLSTIQEWHERVVQTDGTANNDLPETPSQDALEEGEPTKKSAMPADETPAGMQISLSTQQRLEFLQYLVKRGIVNEGVEDI
ncbi:MAG TPA: hypothetical protein VN954_00545 [Ktedonobacteraceae bacterium]|nr:hypothetical protein [Ktedonobacteraceae bacterium]